MASFKSHSWEEGGNGNTTFSVWASKARTAVLDLPGANADIIQKFGRKFAAKRMSAPKRPVARIRIVSISRHVNVCWGRT